MDYSKTPEWNRNKWNADGLDLHPPGSPPGQRPSTEAAIESLRLPVPAEHYPFGPAAFIPPSLCHNTPHQHPTSSPSSCLWQDENVLQEQRRPGEKAAVDKAVDDVSNGAAFFLEDEHTDPAANFPRKPLGGSPPGGLELFKLCQRPHQRHEFCAITLSIRPDLHRISMLPALNSLALSTP